MNIEDFPDTPVYWGRRESIRLYGPKIRAFPEDSPVWDSMDSWWHHVLPIAPGQPALVASRIESLIEGANDRAHEAGVSVAALTWRVRPHGLEFLTIGAWRDRRELKKRVKTAVARDYRLVHGRKLEWINGWAIFLENDAFVRDAHEHFGLPRDFLERLPVPPPTVRSGLH